jgi:hypothetical protein
MRFRGQRHDGVRTMLAEQRRADEPSATRYEKPVQLDFTPIAAPSTMECK